MNQLWVVPSELLRCEPSSAQTPALAALGEGVISDAMQPSQGIISHVVQPFWGFTSNAAPAQCP